MHVGKDCADFFELALTPSHEFMRGSQAPVRCIIVVKSEHNQKQERNGTMKAITKVMTMVAFAVGLLGIHDALAQRDYDTKTV